MKHYGLADYEHEVDLDSHTFRANGFGHSITITPGDWHEDGWFIMIDDNHGIAACNISKEESVAIANMILERYKNEH